MKLNKRIISLVLVLVMFVVGMAVPVSAATSNFYHFPLVTESMGGGYMAAAVAVQKFLMLFKADYASRLMQNGGTDGFFGRESASLTASFQHSYGLVSDGKVGSKTWLKIEAFMRAESDPDVGGVTYTLDGNSVYKRNRNVISYPYSNGYAAYDQEGNPTVPFYYP